MCLLVCLFVCFWWGFFRGFFFGGGLLYRNKKQKQTNKTKGSKHTCIYLEVNAKSSFKFEQHMFESLRKYTFLMAQLIKIISFQTSANKWIIVLHHIQVYLCVCFINYFNILYHN